nr:circularly permuted type 2 ATP-grasp protein [Desulfurispira natronophila]
MDHIFSLESSDVNHTQQEVQQFLRENGVTYSTFHEEGSDNRPWHLDLIPFLVQQEEWQVVEAGLLQRANLLNMILADLYGPRTLIRDSVVPLEMIFSHSGFLRPCDQPTTAQSLTIYAADLARGPDNRVWVLNDRTQAPSGLGYALENRMILSRIMPRLMRSCQTHRLASFFRVVRDTLSRLSPQQKETPRIVLLSPGTSDDMYFEHAYLATYLGYTLVQGEDLTVRDGRVWLKSIEGLLPVDIILRRVQDQLCDPLELRKDSTAGVPGLLEAVRRGNVAIANPIGSGVLENPGLMAFMPAIARHFLDEDLILPMVATWWCGHTQEMQYVLENIDKLIITNTLHEPKGHTVYGPKLNKREREQLKARIKATPYAFSGREMVQFSTAPSLVGDQLEPRHAFVRSFLVAQNGGYTAMRGGLARSVPPYMTRSAPHQDPITKDTWVLSSRPQEHISLWKQEDEPRITSQSGSLPSRTAENLYWVGRYAERAETLARLLRTAIVTMADRDSYQEDAIENEGLSQLLRAITEVSATLPGFVGEGSQALLDQPDGELLSVTLDPQRIGSLANTVGAFLRGAHIVRDRWSFDTWRIINDLEEYWKSTQRKQRSSIFRFHNDFNHTITNMVAFTGLTMESMTREMGWLMLDMGRRIERASLLSTLFRNTFARVREPRVEYLLMEAVLVTCESLITYRRRYRSALHLPGVLELVILDGVNPRSLSYQIQTLQSHIEKLPRQRPSTRLDQDQRLILEISTDLRLAMDYELAQVQADTDLRQLDTLMLRIDEKLAQLSDTINRTFFRHASTRRQLVTTLLDMEP